MVETPAIGGAAAATVAAFTRTPVAGERKREVDSEIERSEAEESGRSEADSEDGVGYQLAAREEQPEDDRGGNQFGLGRRLNISV